MPSATSVKKPNFFILGAPKCGTTALAQRLAEHPQIYFSPRKEPHFFNHDGIPATWTLAEYERLFSAADVRHRAIGEGSTHYLFSRVAVPRILEYTPDARFIVCLRNPITMAPALHAECLHQGWETVRDFSTAWYLQELRSSGRRIPGTARRDPDRLLYGPYCRLGEQVQRLYAHVDRDRVLPVLLDDVRRDPAAEYRRVLGFLGADDDGRKDFPVVNARRQTRSVALAQAVRHAIKLRNALGLHGDWGIADRIRRLNTRTPGGNRVGDSTTAALRDYFADDIRRLETLLGRDLSGWLD